MLKPGSLTSVLGYEATFGPRCRYVCLSPNRRHSLADVRYRADFVRFTPGSRHSGQGRECLKLTPRRLSARAQLLAIVAPSGQRIPLQIAILLYHRQLCILTSLKQSIGSCSAVAAEERMRLTLLIFSVCATALVLASCASRTPDVYKRQLRQANPDARPAVLPSSSSERDHLQENGR